MRPVSLLPAMNVLSTLPRRLTSVFLVLGLSGLLLACASNEAPSLYARLGGEKGLTTLVDRSIARAVQDPRTRRGLAGVTLPPFKQHLRVQLCSLAGGGCNAQDQTLSGTLKGLSFTASEFDALVDILREELDQAGAGAAAKSQLLRMLAPMKHDFAAPNA